MMGELWALGVSGPKLKAILDKTSKLTNSFWPFVILNINTKFFVFLMVHILKLMALVETHKSAPVQAQGAVEHEKSGGAQKNALDVSMEALFKYQTGDIDSAEKLFADFWDKYNSSKSFQSEYIQLLLKMGKYGKILELKDIQGEKNNFLVNKARDCLSILNSKNLEEISKLITVSPDSLQVLLANAEYSIRKGDFESAEKYLAHAEKVSPSSDAWLQLKLVVKFALGKIEDGLEVLKHMGERHLHDEYASIYERFMEIRSSEIHPSAKVQHLVPLCDRVLRLKISDSHSPSIFNPLYKKVLETIVEIGCDSQLNGILSYASRLAQIDDSENTIFNYIRAAVVDQQISLAQALMSRHESKLGQNRLRYLRSLVQLALRKMEEKRAAERERRLAEERERMQRGRVTGKAGTDFLNYYKILGANPSSTPEQLKKAHRKKIREAGKRASANSHLPIERRDAEIKNINKAYQTLSDPAKKRAYDMGIDPEAAPQQPQARDSRSGYGGFFREDEVDEIFQTLFGRGRGSRRASGRTQYIFFQ